MELFNISSLLDGSVHHPAEESVTEALATTPTGRNSLSPVISTAILEVVVGCVAVLLVSLLLSLAYTIYLFKRRISTVEEFDSNNELSVIVNIHQKSEIESGCHNSKLSTETKTKLMLLDPSAKFKEVPPESLISESNCSRLRPAIENINKNKDGSLWTEVLTDAAAKCTINTAYVVRQDEKREYGPLYKGCDSHHQYISGRLPTIEENVNTSNNTDSLVVRNNNLETTVNPAYAVQSLSSKEDQGTDYGPTYEVFDKGNESIGREEHHNYLSADIMNKPKSTINIDTENDDTDCIDTDYI